MLQAGVLPSGEDGLLDAILDELTIDPQSNLASVIAQVEQARVAQSTGEKLERRKTKEQQECGARLQKEWSHVTGDMSGTHVAAAVDTLTVSTLQYLRGLSSDLDNGSNTTGRALSLRGDARVWGTQRTASLAVSRAPELSVEAISPLLERLTEPSSVPLEKALPDETTCALRRAYLRLLPSALQTAAAAASTPAPSSLHSSSLTLDTTATPSDGTVVAWYHLYTASQAVRQLMSPYVSSTVEPCEREVRFHFRAGRDTAALHEPQHFFSFFFDCLERQQSMSAQEWDELPQPQGCASESVLSLLRRVGQLVLSAAAVVVFQDCYGWRPHSPLWRCPEYVVVTVNAVLDFVARVEGRLSRDAVQLVVRHLLRCEVLESYAQAGAEMGQAALHSGPARLWRRLFLTSYGERAAFPLYTGSLHMVRALEAFLRRLLNTLFLADAAPVSLFWCKTVEPTLSAFLEVVEAHAVKIVEEAEPSWGSVLALQWCVTSVQAVTIAAEDWLGMLRESASSPFSVSEQSDRSRSATSCPLTTSEALDSLALFRDKLSRRSAEQAKTLTRQMCEHTTADSAVAARLLHDLDAFMKQTEQLPEGSSRFVLLAVIQSVLHERLSNEHQASLSAFATRSGLHHLLLLVGR